MPAAVDVHGPAKAVLMVASSPTTSPQTGWPIGFWWSELTHPYWEFAETGHRVTIDSPDGGALQADNWSDPPEESRYSSDDLITRRLIASDQHKALVDNTIALADVDTTQFDALFLVGGQAPMYTFRADQRVKDLTGDFVSAGKTCVLLDAVTPDGQRIQPFRIEDEARKLSGTNFIVQGRFRSHAVRDDDLITGQQQYSGAAAARLVVQALGR
jgi:putative intracellular protease/amidase